MILCSNSSKNKEGWHAQAVIFSCGPLGIAYHKIISFWILLAAKVSVVFGRAGAKNRRRRAVTTSFLRLPYFHKLSKHVSQQKGLEFILSYVLIV